MDGRKTRDWKTQTGFTLLEIMIAVALVGVLATIAIPAFFTYQLRSKTAEAKTNLAAIRTLENSYYAEYEQYAAAAAEPPGIPGSVSAQFDGVGSDFAELGFEPEGPVYFSYGVRVSVDGAGFTADAAADIDSNGLVQFWGFTKPDGSGVRPPGEVGCTVAALALEQVGPCSATAGQTTF